MIAPRAEAHLDGTAFEPTMERHSIERASAFVEQACHHGGHARLIRGILVRAAKKSEVQRDHGGGIAHQPSFDSTGTRHALDRHRARRRCLEQEHCRSEDRREQA